MYVCVKMRERETLKDALLNESFYIHIKNILSGFRNLLYFYKSGKIFENEY